MQPSDLVLLYPKTHSGVFLNERKEPFCIILHIPHIKGMSVENKSVFGCPEVQQRPDSAKGECGDQVCQEKRTLTKDTVCINEYKLIQKIKTKTPKTEDLT